MSRIPSFLRPQAFSCLPDLLPSTRSHCVRIAQAHRQARRPQWHQEAIEDQFVGFLVQAGRCKAQKRALHKTAQRNDLKSDAQHDGTGFGTATLPDIPRGRYLELADIYGIAIETPEEDETEMNHSKEHFPLAPRLVLSPMEEEALQLEEEEQSMLLAEGQVAQQGEESPIRIVREVPLEYAHVAERFAPMLDLSPGAIPTKAIWDVFEQLPSPQAKYLTFRQIGRLFSHIMWTQYRHAEGTRSKFLTLLEQASDEGFVLSKYHWTSLIVLTGRASRHTTSDDLKEAIETWVKMEEAGVKADHVVFHVLFDLAIRAGRFALADTVYNELKSRNMPLNRNFRSSMIMQAGMKQDGDAVRAAFTDFVNAGEIVDTSVMNLVIRCLIRSDEGTAAEHVFEHMKELHRDKFPNKLPQRWQDHRQLLNAYNRESQRLRQQGDDHKSSFFGTQYSSKELIEELQKLAPVHPDATTYRTLIGYHALKSGDFRRMLELLQEMRDEGHRVHGSVFNNIFAGFKRHGGQFSGWSSGELENIWHEFVMALPPSTLPNARAVAFDSEEDRPLHWSVAICKNMLCAFEQCCGKARMITIWKEIRARWHDMKPEEKGSLQSFVRYLELQ